jgi:ariadne-1
MSSISDEDYEYDYSGEEDYVLEDDDDAMEWNPMESLPTIARDQVGICMSPAEDLVPEMKRRSKDVAKILDIPVSAAAALLREHEWSKEDLLEVYCNNSEKLLKRCGVYHRCHPVGAQKSASKDCTICFEPMEDYDKKKLAMPCGHEFCLDCWHGFCTNAIQEDGVTCVHATCPQSGCQEVLTEQEIQIAAPELLQKFQSFQLRSFVESNALTRWCPGKGCKRVACAQRTLDVSVAHCDACFVSFCLFCGEEPHDPCGCKKISLWNDKCCNESETANWIIANTISCPHCSTRIEKNGGCMHITCGKCKQGFCWICLGSHHVSQCNGYGGNPSDVSRAKGELDRYLHYYHRYHAHAEAQEFARKQLKKTEAQDSEPESSDDFIWKDVAFLKAANKQLVECRRVLKYTYVFAYYHFVNPSTKMQQERFEHHQGILESLTESLSKLTEKSLGEIDQTQVINQTAVIDQFMKNILEYVENGMDD